MRIVCIDNSVDMIPDIAERNRLEYYYSERLTIGKIYLVIKNIEPSGYKLIDDLGNTNYYLKDRFITLDVYRDNQLNKIIPRIEKRFIVVISKPETLRLNCRQSTK
jgi:hypothetical protein